MPKQPAFPVRRAMKKKQAAREVLAEMDAPWARLLTLIAPHYPKVGPRGGRPPMPLETMLRVYFATMVRSQRPDGRRDAV